MTTSAVATRERRTSFRVLDGIQQDRVLLYIRGGDVYGLLALFLAIAALVSLYGLFADASLSMISQTTMN